MDNKVEVIGIDHGWSGMKTVHEVFTSGCKEISTEPAFTENLLEFGGKYYKIGKGVENQGQKDSPCVVGGRTSADKVRGREERFCFLPVKEKRSVLYL